MSDPHRGPSKRWLAEQLEWAREAGERSMSSTIARYQDCPFCGHYPVVEWYHGGLMGNRPLHKPKIMVRCDNDECKATPHVIEKDEEEARRLWNTRSAVHHLDCHDEMRQAAQDLIDNIERLRSLLPQARAKLEDMEKKGSGA